jgi:hypothetical protein
MDKINHHSLPLRIAGSVVMNVQSKVTFAVILSGSYNYTLIDFPRAARNATTMGGVRHTLSIVTMKSVLADQ